MPKLKKKTIPSHWPLQLAAAAGKNSKDFFVLCYSSEYDEQYERTNPQTFQSPTSHFTHILHFKNCVRENVFRVPDRLLDIWWSSAGKAYAVGFPRGVFEIDSSGCREIVLKDHEGTFTGIWGVNEDNIFTCGFKPFALYRKYGSWHSLTLPENTSIHLQAVVGFHERDIYFAGSDGMILYFDGKHVRRLETPTTFNLYSLALLDDKTLCVGGVAGIFLYGNKDGWRSVNSNTEANLYSLARFNGQVCYATNEGVWTFDGKHNPTLLIDMPGEWVSSIGDAILLRNGNNSWIFDGTKLTKLDNVL